MNGARNLHFWAPRSALSARNLPPVDAEQGGSLGLGPPRLGQILLHPVHNILRLRYGSIVQILAEEDQIALQAVHLVARLDEAVILAWIHDVLDGNVPLVKGAIEFLGLWNRHTRVRLPMKNHRG